MEELLPILLGILWLVVTAINKNKKRKKTTGQGQRPVTPSKTQREKDILEEIFAISDDEQNYESSTIFQEEPTTVLRAEKEKTVSSDYLMHEISQFEEEGSRATGSIELERQFIFEEELNTDKNFEVNPKKAFIYDAIFRPPYIENYF